MRKKGFSLVELLIVLAVMAALIATITPVALNAIRKAKATQVAQNLKTLASAFENKLYVDGTSEVTTDVSVLARDVNASKYSIAYAESSGNYTVTICYKGDDVNVDQVSNVLKEATSTKPGYTPTSGELTGTVFYTIEFNVY
ncbi:N-terminal cleavage protein [Kosmotoga arenicorallina S304]|uniref:N-terminal cleavage protein n=1 Tax=Kosmotoga arenicorallina S304 TaxID=1453497 RepID=A0A176K045_9BACT|nr:type II secretion system protein [Kosmotoga arenicorallina]OAA29710.1 N-terminal cleavage protein [Kosmotoga arenicorallina S304]